MKPLSKEKRDRLLLLGVGTLAVLAGMYYGLIATQRGWMEEVDKRQFEQENKLQMAQRLAGSIGAIKQNLEASKQRLKAIESGMASGDMYSWVILTVNSFKENYHVDIPQFSREVPTEVGMFGRFPYRAANFSLRGTAYFHDLGKFVADFENTFPYMRLQNIELDPVVPSGANTQNDPEKLGFKLEIVALVTPNVD